MVMEHEIIVTTIGRGRKLGDVNPRIQHNKKLRNKVFSVL